MNSQSQSLQAFIEIDDRPITNDIAKRFRDALAEVREEGLLGDPEWHSGYFDQVAKDILTYLEIVEMKERDADSTDDSRTRMVAIVLEALFECTLC